MDLTSDWQGHEAEIAALFEATFTASEGAGEGRLIGALATALMAETAPEDIHVFLAREDGALAGCIIFTRLTYPEDARRVVLMAPVAVATDRQGRGIGQALIAHGLAELRRRGVDAALTYGDPAYYGKVGFRPITEEVARAPQPLSQPHGWLGQALDGGPLAPLKGPARCVAPFDRPDYW